MLRSRGRTKVRRALFENLQLLGTLEKRWQYAIFNRHAKRLKSIGKKLMKCVKVVRCVLMISVAILVSACSNNVPTCSDPQATNLVIEITKEEIAKQFGEMRANEVGLSLDAIRTTEKNKTTGAFDCAAELVSSEGVKSPITYTVEVTDDKRVYVTVFGL